MQRSNVVISIVILLTLSLYISADAYSASPSGAAREPQQQYYEKMLAKTKHKKSIRVIVVIKDDDSERRSTSAQHNEIREQRINQKQEGLLSHQELRNVRNVKKMQVVPHIIMDVTEDELRFLIESPEVEAIEENVIMDPLLLESLPAIGGSATGVFTSNNAAYGGAGQRIVILDTPTFIDHEMIRSAKVPTEACFSTNGVNRVSLCPSGGTQEFGRGAASNPNVCFQRTNVAGTNIHCLHGLGVGSIAAGYNWVREQSEPYSGVARRL